MQDCPLPCEVVRSHPAEWKPPSDAGVVVTHMHYRWEEVSALRRILESRRIPVLILADGILEYRNTWENPTLADGAVFQPVVGHKLACLGRAQARIVESWGQLGKCEVVGSPRIDAIADEVLPVQADGPFRILIASASTPAFNQQQRDQVVQSLRDLKRRFESNNYVNFRPVEVSWRLTDGLHQEVGVEASKQKDIALSDAIELVDAVITTPSTMYLESVLKRRPTAVLDYSNSPSYVSSAWQITAPAHINRVLQELESPPAPKMKFQRSTLEDQLELGNSKQRLHQLIQGMADCGSVAREQNRDLELPQRMLPDSRNGFQPVESEYDMVSLYPENSLYRIHDQELIKQELNLAIARMGDLPQELSEKEVHIQSLTTLLENAETRIQASRDREARQAELVQEKSEFLKKKTVHIASLNELFQDANQRAKRLGQKVTQQSDQLIALQKQVQSLTSELVSLRGESLVPVLEEAFSSAGTEEPTIIQFPNDRSAA